MQGTVSLRRMQEWHMLQRTAVTVQFCRVEFLTSELDGDERLVSRSGLFTPKEGALDSHWI